VAQLHERYDDDDDDDDDDDVHHVVNRSLTASLNPESDHTCSSFNKAIIFYNYTASMINADEQ